MNVLVITLNTRKKTYNFRNFEGFGIIITIFFLYRGENGRKEFAYGFCHSSMTHSYEVGLSHFDYTHKISLLSLKFTYDVLSFVYFGIEVKFY